MFTDIIALILAVVVILLCAELFTNGIEWFGHMLKLPERVIGSVLAAIGTSLPETVVPFVAVICFGKAHGNDVSIGAIIGSPFMLVTLAFAACGAAISFYSLTKRRSYHLNIDRTFIVQNLQYFLISYSFGLIATFLPGTGYLHWFTVFCPILVYVIYVLQSFSQPAGATSHPEKLHFSKLLLKEANHEMLVVLQIIVGTLGIICGAYIFVDHLQAIADSFHVSTLLMSLIVTPIATELPEQATAIMWARRGKDNLAMGTISGSMVFKSCFAVAFGVACTPWKLDPSVMTTAVVTLGLAAVYMVMLKNKVLTPVYLMGGIVVYAATMFDILCLHN